MPGGHDCELEPSDWISARTSPTSAPTGPVGNVEGSFQELPCEDMLRTSSSVRTSTNEQRQLRTAQRPAKEAERCPPRTAPLNPFAACKANAT